MCHNLNMQNIRKVRMFHTTSLITIEQIYNFLKKSPNFKNSNQFEKLKFFSLNFMIIELVLLKQRNH
jgi:hypothetical protein